MKRWLLIGLVALLLAPSFAILNVKEYHPEDKTILIKDWLGLSDYLSVKMISNYGFIDCETQLELTPAQDMTYKEAFGSIKYVGTSNHDFTSGIISAVEFLVPEDVVTESPAYSECMKKQLVMDNKTHIKTEQEVASWCQTGTSKDIKTIYKWTTLKDDEVLKAKQIYKVKITATKPKNIFMDWIGQFGGIWTPEFAWWNTTFNPKQQIQLNLINSTFSRGTNITIPINVSTSTLIGAGYLDANCNGIAFTNSSENSELKWVWDNQTHSKTGCNKANSLAWVKMEGWDGNANNSAYAYYSATDSRPATNPFADYKAVYSGDTRDRAGTATLTPTNMGNGYIKSEEDGLYGYKYNITKGTAVNNGVRWEASASGIAGLTTGTLELWVTRQDTGVDNEDNFVAEGGAGANGYFIMSINKGGNSLYYKINNGAGAHEWTQTVSANNFASTQNVPQYIALEWDAAGVYVYINGTLATTLVDANPLLPAGASPKFSIGSTYSGGYYAANAGVDDVRISTFRRSEDYLMQRYQTGLGRMQQSFGAYDAGSVAGTVTLNTPINNQNFTSTPITFNCSAVATTGNTLSNITTIIWYGGGTRTHLFDISVLATTNTSVSENVVLNDGMFMNWTCLYEDATSKAYGVNRTLSIDSTPPTITITTPANTSYTTYLPKYNVTINVAQTDASSGLGYCWYYNSTTNVTMTCNTITTMNLTAGSYGFTFFANDTFNNTGYENRSFRIVANTVPPGIKVNYPSNASGYVSFNPYYNITVNTTTSLPVASSLDSCWYNNGTNQLPLTCNTNITGNFTSGWHEIIIYTNDTLGNQNSTSVSFFINAISYSAIYNATTIETATETIKLNLDATSISAITGNLIYDNSAKTTTTASSSTYANFTSSITTPGVSGATAKEFYWNLTLNSLNFNTTKFTQIIDSITPLNVSYTGTGLNMSKVFNFYDEENGSVLTGFDASINIKYGNAANSSFKTYNVTLHGVDNLTFWINASVGNYSIGYGEIQYSKVGYVSRRYYFFTSEKFTNDVETLSLYALENSQATSFLFTFQDAALNVYDDRYSALWRWYPGENKYKIVDMGRTDENGQSIMRLVTEDVDYRVGLYEQTGELIKLTLAAQIACLATPCTYTVVVRPELVDWTTYDQVQNSLTYNSTSKKFTFVYNDLSKATQSMTLSVVKVMGNQSVELCNSVNTDYFGVMTCDVSAYTGIFKAVAYRTASPLTPIAELLTTTFNSVFKGGFGLLISAFLMILFVSFGLFMPQATIIMAIISLIPAVILGSVSLVVFMGIALMGGVFLHLMRKI